MITTVMLLLVSCDDIGAADTFYDFMTAVSLCDGKTASGIVSSDTSLERYCYVLENADDEARSLLYDIYSSFEMTVLSENVEAENVDSDVVITETGKQTIRVKLTYLDLRSIMSIVSSESAASSDVPSNILSEYIADGTVRRYIVSNEIEVVLIKENGEWRLPLSRNENSYIYDALMLNTFAAWLIG